MKLNATTTLALLCALLLGALGRDLLVPRAHADNPTSGFTGTLAERLVRATEAQAKAAEDTARAVHDAERACSH